MNIPPESKHAFLVCAFSMLGKIAAADGRISADELSRIERYIDSELRLDKKLRAVALDVFRDAVNSPLEIRDYAEKFHAAFPDRVHLLDQMVELLLDVSFADGRFSPEEEEQVRSAALLLGLSAPGYARLREKCLERRGLKTVPLQ